MLRLLAVILTIFAEKHYYGCFIEFWIYHWAEMLFPISRLLLIFYCSSISFNILDSVWVLSFYYPTYIYVWILFKLIFLCSTSFSSHRFWSYVCLLFFILLGYYRTSFCFSFCVTEYFLAITEFLCLSYVILN